MQTYLPNLTLPQTRLLASVIKTTRTMLDLARQQEWDAVAELERLRREDLTRCFAIPASDDQGELLAEALAVLLHLNEELMSKLVLAKDKLSNEGKTEARQLHAVGEYERMRRLR
jgi:hypothetical protein